MDNKLERHFHCVVFAEPGAFPLNDLPTIGQFSKLSPAMIIYCVETDKIIGYFGCVQDGLDYLDESYLLLLKLEIPFYWEWHYAEAIDQYQALVKVRQGEMYEIY